MLKLKRFDEMTEAEYQQTFHELVEAVRIWHTDLDEKKFHFATTNLKQQLIEIGMTKAEAQRLIWNGSIQKARG